MTFSALLRRARGSTTAPLAATALLVIAAAATAQTAAPQAPRLEPLEGEYVATTRANVRQLPSAQAPRVGRLESGATVRVTGKVAGASWLAVMQEDGTPGFVAADLLRALPPSAAAPVPAPAEPVAATPTPAPAPTPAQTPPPLAAGDAALKEQLTKIESALTDINRQMPSAKELENLSAAVKGLLEREQKRLADEATAPAEPTPAPAPPPEGPGIAERMTKLQDQITQQIAEQRAEFGRLGEKLESVESSVQPLIDWAKNWTSMAAPAADSAQGWLSSTYVAVRDWLLGWIPWWNTTPQPPMNPPMTPPTNPPPRT